MRPRPLAFATLFLFSVLVAHCGTAASAQTAAPKLVQPTLIAPGSLPFHLSAVITELGDPNDRTTVEMFWVAPNQWRREIKGPEFSQTRIVNGDNVFEQNSDDYFPLAMRTLTTAMVDPSPFLSALRPGDRLETKANGASKESGVVCFGPHPDGAFDFCGSGRGGLSEFVGAPGHPVEFTQYRKFGGERVARLVISSPGPGEGFQARITNLDSLHDNPQLFVIDHPTPKDQQIDVVVLDESEMQALLPKDHQIIWPQVLDGQTTGSASYYVSVDRTGRVRETSVVKSDNERANDSARRQIKAWKFNPALKDGMPVQAEGILSFPLNTRAWGPSSPLSNEEARKLASNITEPDFPSSAPKGAVAKVKVAVDADGNVIEMIADESGASGLSLYTMEAIRKWHFSPIMENGQPRPYRAELEFKVP